MFKAQSNILPPNQKELWPRLAPASQLGFVLYGGTAIALRLGHRESVDFDFFSNAPLDKDALAQAFPFLTQSRILQNERNTLTALVPPMNGGGDESRGVKVSFFGGLTLGRVGVPEMTDDSVLQVASLDDLMAMKVKVIMDRSEAKDYNDIAAMINAGVSLAKGLSSAKAIFGDNFPVSVSLKALVYFEDGDLSTLLRATRRNLVKAAAAIGLLPPSELASQSLDLPLNTPSSLNGSGRTLPATA